MIIRKISPDGYVWRQSVASVSFLIIFAILMPILLMNLLIGLAVGDIETVRRNASMKRLAMQIHHHTDLVRRYIHCIIYIVSYTFYRILFHSREQERRIPKQMLLYVRKLEVYEYPNKISSKCKNNVMVSKSTLAGENKSVTPCRFVFDQWWALSKIFGSNSYSRQNFPAWKVQPLNENKDNLASSKLNEEIVEQRRRLREMSRCQLQQLQLIRLIVQRMEIQTDDIGDYYGYDADKEEPEQEIVPFLRRRSTAVHGLQTAY